MTDDGLLTQLRAYAQQLDELPAEPRLAPVVSTGRRPPRWTRREWIAIGAAVAVLAVIATVRIAGQASDSTPSVSTGGAVTVTRAWTRDLGAQVDRTIDVPGGRTIVDVAPQNTGDSTLVALDRATGRVLWRHRFPYRVGPWGLDGNTLVAGITNRTMGVDVRTGKQRWLVDVAAVTESSPPVLVHDHVAYLVGGEPATMTALDVRTHRVLWTYAVAGTMLVPPAVMGDSIAVAVSPLPLDNVNGFVEVLDRATGTVRSHTLVPGSAFVGLIGYPVDLVFAATNQRFGSPPSAQPAQMTLVTDARTCPYSFGGIPSNPVAAEHEIVVSSSLGFVGAYRCAGSAPGLPLWRTTGVGANQAPAIEPAGEFPLAVAGAELHGINAADGSIVWTALVRDAYFPAPAAGEPVVAVSRTDGRLFVVDASDGRVVTTVKDGTSQTGVTLQRDGMVTASDRGVVTGYRIRGR